MKYVTDSKQSRDIDRYLIETCGISGTTLMENAAAAVMQSVLCRSGNILVVCGTGNNGGDGFAMLRQAAMYEKNALAVLVGDESKLSGDALINYEIAKRLNLNIITLQSGEQLKKIIFDNKIKIIVDALFGTGLTRNVCGLYADVISVINDCEAYKIAVDIPSGVSADSGKICGCCVIVDETVTFQTVKRGAVLFPGRSCVGALSVSPIGVYSSDEADFMLSEADVMAIIPKRLPNSHKGTYGKQLVIAGSDEYKGACLMAANAALKSGVGILRVMCPASLNITAVMPEAIGIEYKSDAQENVKNAKAAIAASDAISIGMGLTKSEIHTPVVRAVLESGRSAVIDADALNIIADNKEMLSLLNENCVLTPHIGEFSRLLGVSVADIETDTVNILRSFATKHNTNVLLKGATTLICSSQGRICFNITGNSALSKGGSGDTLSGLIGSLAAQGMSIFNAACAGAYILGKAAENTEIPQRCATATDIVSEFSAILNK